MSFVWSEAVIPGLALLLFLSCGTELVLRRFFKGRSLLFRRGASRRPLTGHAFDEFNLLFNGNKLVELKQQQQQEVLRDEEGDGAPPRTRIDLNSGTARVVLPSEEDGARETRPSEAPASDDAASDDAASDNPLSKSAPSTSASSREVPPGGTEEDPSR